VTILPATRIKSLSEKSKDSDKSAEQIVFEYHERSKHHYHRFAASSGYMDWATQPDPFRRYGGAPLIHLPLPEPGRTMPYWQLYADDCEPAPLSIESVSLFFRYSLSLTAWKRLHDNAWSLRANPSSGNLHPTEGYALLPAVERIHDRPGLYHYAPKEHCLERRTELESSVWTALSTSLPNDFFLVALTSIHWRESWKYGERAFRYCQHDIGHALGTLRFAAAALGWEVSLLDPKDSLAKLLGLNRAADYIGAEREASELLAIVHPRDCTGITSYDLSKAVASQVADSRWYGRANVLSHGNEVTWPVIDLVSAATSHPTPMNVEDFSEFPLEESLFEMPIRHGDPTAEYVILGRRSAVSMDASTSISAATFYQMLARLVPTQNNRSVPWDAIPWRPRIHLGLFVHRVNNLTPGLYALVRDSDKLEPLKQVMRPDFLWQRPASCPSGLSLYLLKEADCRAWAAGVSCGQEIAGDGAFSLGMIADYENSLARYRAAFYRNLFWEAGLIGQVLYLEAEAAGIRATGIGCYFDDAVHEVFGITSRAWQSLYHFTVGGPVEDKRLTTLPAYATESQ
jgi:SagB-type dehydrogenase family enzyme